MSMPIMSPTPTAPQPSRQGGGSDGPTTGGAEGSGTQTFGNLEGRDPDLLFAGEKITVNGKEVTVADGDTLSSLAAKHGTTVEKLIAENKMNAALLGKNAQGDYFTSSGPMPTAPGGTTRRTAPPDNDPPATTPEPTPSSTSLPSPEKARDMVRGMAYPAMKRNDNIAPDSFGEKDAQEMRSLLTQIGEGKTLSSEQQQRLSELLAIWTPTPEPSQ